MTEGLVGVRPRRLNGLPVKRSVALVWPVLVVGGKTPEQSVGLHNGRDDRWSPGNLEAASFRVDLKQK